VSAVEALLKALTEPPGVSGHEGRVREVILEKWTPLVDQVNASARGSIHALKRGATPTSHRSLMVAAHMDSVGLLVSAIDDSFLRVSAVGMLDPRVLAGTPVTVHGLRDLPGVIARLLTAQQANESAGPALPGLVVDTGLSAVQLRRQVRIGDPISFSGALVELAGGWVSGRSLDNRASIAALTFCLEELAEARPGLDLWAVATTSEETNLGGAITSAFSIAPDLAIAVDTTFGKSPGSEGWQTFDVGGGPTLATGPNMHPALHRRLREIADELGIPYAIEPVPASSDTDAMALQVTRAGIPTMLIEIPIRYMHTAVEVAAIDDIERAGRLLAGFVSTIDDAFVEGLTWDG